MNEQFKVILFKNQRGEYVAPVTHSDLVQYKDNTLTYTLDNLSSDVETAYTNAYTAAIHVDEAYTTANIAKNAIDTIISHSVDLSFGTKRKIITKLYFENNKLSAKTEDITSAIILHKNQRLLDYLNNLENSIKDIHNENTVKEGLGISVDTNEDNETTVSIKKADDTIKLDNKGLSVGIINASQVNYIKGENKENLQLELDNIWSKIRTIDTGSENGGGIRGIIVNKDKYTYYGDNDNIAHINVNAENIYLQDNLPKVTTDVINKEDNLATIISKLDNKVASIDDSSFNYEFVISNTTAPKLEAQEILKDFN